MQFTVLHFGLQCAPAAFSRLMRKVFHGLSNVKNYIDDIIVYHATWDRHLEGIRSVLERLQSAGLTARPTKCLIAFPEVEFLGHKIGSGTLCPTTEKVEAIRSAETPQTKKQLRSFLGLAGFYRRYIPNFSAIANPRTDATKKGMPNKIQWDQPHERAFQAVKSCLSKSRVLRQPDFKKTFILATDASDTGVGAVLMQQHDDGKYPVA
ncbi:Pol polyprotein [Plakobranchus ocellatus]|uniref:Pol polyprotein n=1 Tax=Plakobranchus ocellatus TaxID=259542 RepID=A0AAV3Y084_9GAST|nr:Pol polyprotein [Plakobranchus ocellatus]